MRVFWPTSGIDRQDGVVVGWRFDDTLCVVGIVEEWVGPLTLNSHIILTICSSRRRSLTRARR